MRDGYRDLWASIIERELLDACNIGTGIRSHGKNSVSAQAIKSRHWLKNSIDCRMYLDVLGVNHKAWSDFISQLENCNWDRKVLMKKFKAATKGIYRSQVCDGILTSMVV